jgi:hypothetical protein
VTDLIPPDLSRPGAVIRPEFDAPPQLLCRFCHNGPAVKTTFRQHTGMIIVMRFSKIEGPFCRDCGLSAFRETTGHTMVAGWWGYFSMILAPLTILLNLVRRGRVAKLPAPVVIPGRGRPADPGRPLLLRATALGLLVPLALVGGIAYLVTGDSADSLVGRCVSQWSSASHVEFVDCAEGHKGRITAVVDSQTECPTNTIDVVWREWDDGTNRDGKLLCVGQ